MMLRIEAPHFVAGISFEKRKGEWFPSEPCAPILRWLLKKHPKYIQAYVNRPGFKWIWIK